MGNAELTGRDLDAFIAEHLLGYKWYGVGPDADGKNPCKILVEHGSVPDGYQLPPKGWLHPALLVPRFSSNLPDAIRLAKRFGWTAIPINCDDIPLEVCRQIILDQLGAPSSRPIEMSLDQAPGEGGLEPT